MVAPRWVSNTSQSATLDLGPSTIRPFVSRWIHIPLIVMDLPFGTISINVPWCTTLYGLVMHLTEVLSLKMRKNTIYNLRWK